MCEFNLKLQLALGVKYYINFHVMFFSLSSFIIKEGGKFMNDLDIIDELHLPSFMKEHFNFSDIEQKNLYHYTDIYGLEGILKHKEFWVSSANFLNDKTEIKYTLELCRELIIEICERKQIDDSQPMFLFEFFVKSHLEETDYYLLSFCTNPDSNLLWSNYSNNDGYNISFKFPEIAFDFYKEDSEYPLVAHVIYDKKKQKEILKGIIERFISLSKFFDPYKFSELDQLLREGQGKELFVRLSTIITAINISSLFFKDVCFSQEEEFRIAISRESYSCRISNGTFIPYIKARFEKESVTGITIGPKNNMDITMEGLIQFLKLHEYNHIMKDDIRKSCIPYRY